MALHMVPGNKNTLVSRASVILQQNLCHCLTGQPFGRLQRALNIMFTVRGANTMSLPLLQDQLVMLLHTTPKSKDTLVS